MRGVFGTIALSMFFYTLQQIPLASAVTIQYLSPIFTALFAAIFLKEKMKLKQWIYFAIAFGGVALLKVLMKSFFKFYACWYYFRYVFWHGIHLYTSTKRNRSSLSGGFLLSSISHSYNGCFKLFSVGKTNRKGLELILLLMGAFTQIAQVLMTKGLQSAAVNKIISVKYIGTFWALAFGYILLEKVTVG